MFTLSFTHFEFKFNGVSFKLKRNMSDDFLYDYFGNVKVWIDGSCLGNGKRNARAGYGIVYNWDHYMYVLRVIVKLKSY